MAYNRNSKHRGNDRYQGDKRQDKRTRKEPTNRIKYSGKRPSNFTLYIREGEDQTRAIKRFIKGCKKERIVEDARERRYFVKPSMKRRLAEKKRQQNLRKLRQEQEK
jgi:ribosomal protein S21|tara:strand:- start:948 stop:1268 length:321 start_codon:yes stop_codon:yes gene_type:complete